LKKAVIILAGGLSRRFGQDKCMKELDGRPLVAHVLHRVAKVAEERLIVVSSRAQQDRLRKIFQSNTDVVIDKHEGSSPLIGALTGFEKVKADLALLLPCDAALVSSEIATLLLDLCVGRSAAIPRWPDGKIEPLQAAYDVKLARKAAATALDEGKRDMIGMITHMRHIRYVSTLVLQQYDKRLTTFFNINTPEDWKRAESMFRRTK
jgi:molybdopterin-guanine dinucleotide biosynthesis protein A